VANGVNASLAMGLNAFAEADRPIADVADIATGFGALLTAAGVLVPPDRAARFTSALMELQPTQVDELRWIARTTLTMNRAQRSTLDAVFDQVFLGRIDDANRGGGHAPLIPKGIEAGQQAPKNKNAPSTEAHGERPRGGSSGDQSGTDNTRTEQIREALQMTASVDERLGKKDFGSCSSAELIELSKLISDLSLTPPIRRSHRRRRSDRGAHHDLRRTIRAARATGGDPVRLVLKGRVERERRVVLIADISSSMERYARAYLYLLHAAVRALTAEAFVFSTQLTRATSVLRHHSPEIALHQASEAVPDWSGGTRIGEALREFLDQWGRRGVARGSVIVIISDGWEGGDPTHLAEQMARLSRLSHRIVWVNPRKQHAEYQPLVAGMAAALPFIDSFVSGHSYQAMREVAAAIAKDR
jgi:uncharacterized protein